jgi:RimJ/RimL family protein N-acetyltransferase
LDLERVIGLVDPANVASVRILEKLGLTPAGEVQYDGKRYARYVIQARGTA